LSCVVFELSSRVRSVASTFSSPVPYARVRTRNCSEPSSESHATLLGSRLENRQVVVNQGNQDDGQHVTRGRSGWPQRCKTQRGVARCSGLGHEEFHERYPGWSTVRGHAQSSAPSAAESDWRTQPRLDFRRRAASMESPRKAVDATLANPSGPRSRSHARPGLDLAIQGTSCHPALLFSGPSHDMARTAHAGRVRSREVGGAGGLSARTHTADMGDRAAYCETIGRQASEDLSREAARSSSQHASALPGRAQTNQGQARRRIAAGSGERRARIDQQDLRNEGGRNGDGTAR
jgi:hypothetical protein